MDISGPRNLAYEGAEFLRRIEILVQDLVVGNDEKQDAYPTMMVPAEDKLSRRQREVLILIAEGMTSSEIAKKLDLGTSTVISHRRSLMKVLGLHSAADLTRFAIKHDLLSK
jgi:DNA-binding NarL/FixJ family response regulator